MTAMPAQRPGKSEQDVTTPWRLIDAVEKRFGSLHYDLAASVANCRVRPPHYGVEDHYGIEENSLEQDWVKLSGNLSTGLASVWSRRELQVARFFSSFLRRLGPLGMATYVWCRCRTILLPGRVRFEGHVNDYPKDLMLCVYECGATGVELWDWRKKS